MEHSEEALEIFSNIVNEILEKHNYNYRVFAEIVDDTFVVKGINWYIEFCKDGFFNVCSRGWCGIDRDSLEIITDIADNVDNIFAEIEKHLTNITAE